ncbi:MAG: DUF6198 family protein [Eubacteriales bacterium]
MQKRIFYTEPAYVLGLTVLAVGTALMVRANLGVSMVVAPAYLLHLKLSQTLPFFSFGMAEYTLQAVILLLMTVVLRKAKLSYLFSFVTAVLYGLLLDGVTALLSLIPSLGTVTEYLLFIPGFLLCSAGVSLLFHTYIPPEAYELFVKEVSARIGMDIHKFKTLYDCISCLVGIVLSFLFFGMWHFEGIKIGTVVCALLNGSIIRLFSRLFEKVWTFEDRFPLRKYF